MEEKERSYKMLVYGVEKRGITAPSEPLNSRNFEISFEPFNTNHRFNEYDGVILFQGIFEQFERKSSYYSNSYLAHSCDNDELDKRKKEAHLLLENGGFLCFLLNEPFIDREGSRDFGGSDLAKYHLSYSHLYRDNYSNRRTDLDIKSDDFRRFLSVYGAASSHFRHYNEYIDWRVLAKAGGKAVGMIINRNKYFIPTLVPDNQPEVIEEYFILLSEGLTSSNNKLQQALPEWIDEFKFEEETKLGTEREALDSRIQEIDYRINALRKHKSVLIFSGDDLVTNVIGVFADGFGFAVDRKDEFREDFKILDSNSKPICLCEAKGTNKGVKREYVNQADSHRERAQLDSTFPTLLIVNTHIKNARSVSEKDQTIASEQIQHAVKMNVLMMRTIDLLGLLKSYLKGDFMLQEVQNLITKNSGWLRVSENVITVLSGNESESIS